MDKEEFIIYQRFMDKNDVIELIEKLEDNNIPFVAEDNTCDFDPSFANNEQRIEYIIKLKKPSFQVADKLLLEIEMAHLQQINSEYYLYEFSDDELYEILYKSEEWSKFDFLVAQKILNERGRNIDMEEIENLKSARINKLSQPEKHQTAWIIFGYFLTISVGIIGVFTGKIFGLFAFIGIFIGRHLMTYKKTLPNGDKVPAYSVKDQKHGKNILYLGVIAILVWALVSIISFYLT